MAPVGLPFSEPKCFTIVRTSCSAVLGQVFRKHTREEDIDMRSPQFYGASIPP